jgi:hypothetical protein
MTAQIVVYLRPLVGPQEPWYPRAMAEMAGRRRQWGVSLAQLPDCMIAGRPRRGRGNSPVSEVSGTSATLRTSEDVDGPCATCFEFTRERLPPCRHFPAARFADGISLSSQSSSF